MPKFGISIYSVSRKIEAGEWNCTQGIECLANIGAEVIELVPFGMDMTQHPEIVEEAALASEKFGVPLGNYSLNANFLMLSDDEYEAEIKRVKAHMDCVAKLHIPTMRVDCSSYRRPLEYCTPERFQEEFPTVIRSYNLLCDYAEKYGIKILLENHGFFINGAERTAQVFYHMRDRNFGGQLDCGNFVCVDERPEMSIKKNLKYATTIHMKDFYIRPETRDPGRASQFDCSNSWFRSHGGDYLRGSILNQGDLDIPAVIRMIKRGGFDGNIFIEYEGMEECVYGTDVSFCNLKRIWEEV